MQRAEVGLDENSYATPMPSVCSVFRLLAKTSKKSFRGSSRPERGPLAEAESTPSGRSNAGFLLWGGELCSIFLLRPSFPRWSLDSERESRGDWGLFVPRPPRRALSTPALALWVDPNMAVSFGVLRGVGPRLRISPQRTLSSTHPPFCGGVPRKLAGVQFDHCIPRVVCIRSGLYIPSDYRSWASLSES